MQISLFWPALWFCTEFVLATRSISHEQCLLDPSLAPLAAKIFSVDELLSTTTRPRQCPAQAEMQNIRLIFVTPWNAAGYSYTALHAEKLTHVAPVWYQVELEGSTVSLKGTADINQSWMNDVLPVIKIVPRFEVKFASKKEIEAVLFFPRNEANDIVARIVEEVENKSYAGATLEIPYTAQMIPLITSLGKALHKNGKELIVVIPAHHKIDQMTPFGRRALFALNDSVDYFSLNAYDHSGFLGRDVGNAPLNWLRHILDELLYPSQSADVLELDEDDAFEDDSQETSNSDGSRETSPINRKILLGLNFYGFTLTTDSVLNTITQSEYTDLLEFSRISLPLSVEWNESQAEHKLQGKFWTIRYPTLLSILHRLELAREYGVGISVWEGGQGLEHFWDVL